jgi:hypothetical protein
MLYGLSLDDIGAMDLVYLGLSDRTKFTPALAPDLVAAYQRRRWNLGVAILRLNFDLTSPAYAIAGYIDQLLRDARAGAMVKRDELDFFGSVLAELASEERLPLASCLAAADAIAVLRTKRSDPDPDEAHTTALLAELSNRLALLVGQLFDRFDERRLQVLDFSTDATVRVTLHFRQRPENTATDLFNAVAGASGFPIAHETQQLEQRSGSYVEYIRTTLLSLIAFQLFLYLANGCVVQMTELKARVGLLTKRKVPAAYAAMAIRPQQRLPGPLIRSLKPLLALLSGMGWLAESQHRGYLPSNLLSVAMEPMRGRMTGGSESAKTRRRSAKTRRTATRTRS